MNAGRVAGFAILVSSAATASAQSLVVGVVRDDSTARGLPRVEVSIEGTEGSVVTDSAGRYAIATSRGNRVATFRLPGYQLLRTLLIVQRDTVHADITLLHTTATELPAVAVNARSRPANGSLREGFEARRAMGFGKFIDSTALRAREEHRLSDVLRELAGVRFMDYKDPQSSLVEERAFSPLRGPADRTPACYVSVFYNAAPIYRSERGSSFGDPPDFSRDFTVSSLESVEYYRTASEVPQQFGGPNADCGVILLWSRR